MRCPARSWLAGHADGRECRAPFTCSDLRGSTEGSRRDQDGDSCLAYEGNAHWCNYFDDADFVASQMCTACGGGSSCKCPASVGRNDCAVCDYTVDGAVCQRCTNGKVKPRTYELRTTFAPELKGPAVCRRKGACVWCAGPRGASGGGG